MIIIMLGLMLPILASSQCRRFTKVSCIPALGEYVPNENFNSAILIPGDEAELMMTFYAGQDYRVLICTEDILGEVGFKLTDDGGKTIFNSENLDAAFMDFSVDHTQQVKVNLTVPDRASPNNLVHQGCATVLVGYKEKG
ncbi:MAG: hypothetical protein O2867_00455 [Bacteroidetes bacterium]|jgi:hypothetical protein|nr:hypothetical protein [Bacteroidota bacterium]